jgi:uncharacterized membrane protein YgaE (UPF0421/DUF939 family)
VAGGIGLPRRVYVGGRIIKTSLAVGLSIFIAQSLGFERVTLAAIVAMVTIQRTFYRSVLQSLAKLGSVLLGALLGVAFAFAMGGSPVAYSLLILAVILICLRLNWQDNIFTASVVAIGIISSQSANLPLYSLEQLLSALIGALVALVVNSLFSPRHIQDVKLKIAAVEQSLAEMMEIVAAEMLDTEQRPRDMKEKAQSLLVEINTGLQLSKLFREEQRFTVTGETAADRYRDTFRTFASHTERLLEMHILASRMVTDVPQAIPIAKLLRIISKVQKRKLQGKPAHDKRITNCIAAMELSFEFLEMPKNRAEFVSRSSLVHLFKEIKRYYNRTILLPPVLAEETGMLPFQINKKKKKENAGKVRK